MNDTIYGRPSLDQRLVDIVKGTERSELKAMMVKDQGGPPNIRRHEMQVKKEEMMTVVKMIYDLSQWIPSWDDDTLLKALRRRPAYQSWPAEMLKGLILMKTTTINRLS